MSRAATLNEQLKKEKLLVNMPCMQQGLVSPRLYIDMPFTAQEVRNCHVTGHESIWVVEICLHTTFELMVITLAPQLVILFNMHLSNIQ